MPTLTAIDPLPFRPQRVLVAGTSGSGKTTLARRIGAELGIRHVEIDALFHGPGWTARPSFAEDVAAFCSEAAWVTEWQYSTVREQLLRRAELLVWLDLRRATVMRRVVARTLSRRMRRQVLWNGNLEPPLRTVFTDDEHIVRWAWRKHHPTAERIGGLAQRHPELVIVRLRDPRAVRRWTTGPLRTAAGHRHR